MSQRVNIQYSIKLEDLDIEVKRLVSQAHTRVESLGEGEIPLGEETLSLQTLQKITSYRTELAATDALLSDVMNIINGFIEFQTSNTYNVNPEQVERRIAEADDNDPLMGGLQERLEQFRESFAEPNEVSP